MAAVKTRNTATLMTEGSIVKSLLLFALLLLLGLGACLWRGIYLPLLTALRELGPDADGRMPQAGACRGRGRGGVAVSGRGRPQGDP